MTRLASELPGSVQPGSHLVERAVERMAQLAAAAALPPNPSPASAGTAAPVSIADPETIGIADFWTIGMAALEAAGMAVTGVLRSRVAEEWRVVAAHLLRELRAMAAVGPAGSVAAGSNLLMVTSPRPREGKSFSALNLAGSLALGGLAEVLLVDVDSKPGALSEALGLAGRPGLFDLVADPTLPPADLVLPTAIAGLAILPIGRPAPGGPGAVERSVTRPVVAALEQLARHFGSRVVVLDCSPCLATSDAAALAPAMTRIAMVVEAEQTQRGDLEAALELLRPCPHVTLVLNKVRPLARGFGGYAYYGA